MDSTDKQLAKCMQVIDLSLESNKSSFKHFSSRKHSSTSKICKKNAEESKLGAEFGKLYLGLSDEE